MWYETAAGALSDQHHQQDLREAQQKNMKSSMAGLAKSDQHPGPHGLSWHTKISYSQLLYLSKERRYSTYLIDISVFGDVTFIPLNLFL